LIKSAIDQTLNHITMKRVRSMLKSDLRGNFAWFKKKLYWVSS